MDVVKNLRGITKEEAIHSYDELKKVPCNELTLSMGRAGMKALDYYFFHHRIKAKTKRHVSFFDILKINKLLNNLRISGSSDR
jgi:extradiol dioxygenase family protein